MILLLAAIGLMLLSLLLPEERGRLSLVLAVGAVVLGVVGLATAP